MRRRKNGDEINCAIAAKLGWINIKPYDRTWWGFNTKGLYEGVIPDYCRSFNAVWMFTEVIPYNTFKKWPTALDICKAYLKITKQKVRLR